MSELLDIGVASRFVLQAVRQGGKILICGNGGSATQASHFAAELVVRYKVNREAIPCISLSADMAILTACANDFGFPQVFSRQVEAYGKAGDVLIAVSTSGRSKNVLNAIDMALQRSLLIVTVPREGKDTAEIQEYQMRWLHALAAHLEHAYTHPPEA